VPVYCKSNVFARYRSLTFYRIDDVEDDSVLRRGVPAAHHIYGTPQTINCANYVYFLALSEITKLNNAEMITIYTGLSNRLQTKHAY
jgi:geranylgeranyl pyrophosphate synthase